MVTWSSILAKSAALLNDQDRAVYTDTVFLPYLNMAVMELQETFELNNIPVTNEVSSPAITIPAGTLVVGYGTDPALPSNLIEIRQLLESDEGQEMWTPVVKREFLTPFNVPSSTPVAKFGIWAWINQEIHLPLSNQNNDLKIDYIKKIFDELTIDSLSSYNRITNTDTFFIYRTASLVTEFIEENFDRAQALNALAAGSIDRSLGISIKSKQTITNRRLPFRFAWKRRSGNAYY